MSALLAADYILAYARMRYQTKTWIHREELMPQSVFSCAQNFEHSLLNLLDKN